LRPEQYTAPRPEIVSSLTVVWSKLSAIQDRSRKANPGTATTIKYYTKIKDSTIRLPWAWASRQLTFMAGQSTTPSQLRTWNVTIYLLLLLSIPRTDTTETRARRKTSHHQEGNVQASRREFARKKGAFWGTKLSVCLFLVGKGGAPPLPNGTEAGLLSDAMAVKSQFRTFRGTSLTGTGCGNGALLPASAWFPLPAASLRTASSLSYSNGSRIAAFPDPATLSGNGCPCRACGGGSGVGECRPSSRTGSVVRKAEAGTVGPGSSSSRSLLIVRRSFWWVAAGPSTAATGGGRGGNRLIG